MTPALRLSPPRNRSTGFPHAHAATGRDRRAACRRAPACRRYIRRSRITCLWPDSCGWFSWTPPRMRVMGCMTFIARSSPKCRFMRFKPHQLIALRFQIETAQQVLCDQQAVIGGCTPIGQWRDSPRRMPPPPFRSSPRSNRRRSTRASTHFGTLRRSGHAAKCDDCVLDFALLIEEQGGRRHRRRRCLRPAAWRSCRRRKARIRRRGYGMWTASTNSPGARSCLPYSMKKFSSGTVRLTLPLRSMTEAPSADQGRRRVADRRAVGDVAADGAHVAHLLAADAVPEFVQLREVADNDRIGIGVADTGTECQAVFAVGYPPQFIEMRQKHDRSDVAHELRYPQADIGRAGDDAWHSDSASSTSAKSSTSAGSTKRSALADHDALAVLQASSSCSITRARSVTSGSLFRSPMTDTLLRRG